MHALVFDLDGTLVDTVFVHVLAWQLALAEAGVVVDGYRLHRHVGSGGELIVLHTDEPTRVLHEVTEEALREGIELEALEVRRQSLEDVYLELVRED